MIASNWPRFLVVSSTDEGALKKLSSFATQKRLGLFPPVFLHHKKTGIAQILPVGPFVPSATSDILANKQSVIVSWSN